MRFCSQCGERVATEAKFCSACGASARTPEPSLGPPSPPQTASSTVTTTRSRGNAAFLVAGGLALGAAVLAVFAVFLPYSGDASLAEDPGNLWFNLLYVAAFGIAGGCLLSRAGRRLGGLLLVGVIASVFPAYFMDLVDSLRYDTPLQVGWWFDKAAAVLLIAGAASAVIGAVRSRDITFGISKLTPWATPVGCLLVLLYITGRIMPSGDITGTDAGGSLTFPWGALFEGDRVADFVNAFGIGLAVTAALVAGFVKPIRLGAGLLAGWVIAEVATLVGDSISLLRPETIDGTHYTGEVGVGLILRFAGLALIAVLAALGVALKGREQEYPDASPASGVVQTPA